VVRRRREEEKKKQKKKESTKKKRKKKKKIRLTRDLSYFMVSYASPKQNHLKNTYHFHHHCIHPPLLTQDDPRMCNPVRKEQIKKNKI
jgi:hypothetical protein